MIFQNLKKILILLLGILIILIAILAFSFLNQKEITGQIINEYTYTTAVCNENNLCQDYEISCQDEKVIDIKPTGYIVQNSKDWKDPRNPEDIKQWCNIN